MTGCDSSSVSPHQGKSSLQLKKRFPSSKLLLSFLEWQWSKRFGVQAMINNNPVLLGLLEFILFRDPNMRPSINDVINRFQMVKSALLLGINPQIEYISPL